jgi:hypothetical protein
MSSGDFTFITLRNITAYQVNNAYVPNDYLLTMSTNGNARWTNNVNLNIITASTISSNSIYGTYMSTNILVGNEMMVNNMVGETITGNIIRADSLSTLQNTFSSMIMSPATFTTPTNYTNTGLNTVSSMLINIEGTMWKIPIERIA